MDRQMTKHLLTLLVAGCALGAARTAEAGIIIMNNGKVFIGRMEAEDFKNDKGQVCPREDYATVTMHGPQQYKGAPVVRGEINFPKHDIRWLDPNSDEPTDDYMKQYADAPLDPKWYSLYVAPWKEARDNQVQIQPLTSFTDFKSGSLSVMSIPRKWGVDEAAIRRPTGWSQAEQGGITIFQSDQKGTDGYAARIHFFSTEAAIGQVSDQLTWIKQEIEKLASSQDAFETKGQDSSLGAKNVRGGYDAEWTTVTRRSGKAIKAMRAMRFRDHRAYFVTCYAHEKDYDKHATIFRAVVSSLVINEGGKSADATSDAPDVTAVAVGQTYRWKSQNIPDELVWEVTLKDVAAIRHRTTKTTADGSKQVREEPETIAPIDPVARLTAICAAPASPQKVTKETITVSGQAYDCDVYEAAANGKKYKLWLSKKFPMEIKLTVDGQLVKELAEIK